MAGERNLFDTGAPSLEKAQGLNAYLQMAYRAILIENRPLHAYEILATAKDFGFVPEHLHGATPHKTLNARLSEHIQAEGPSALFFRTAPATYFLCDLAEQLGEADEFKIYQGIRRSKQVKHENVLVARKEEIDDKIGTGLTDYNEKDFRSFLSSSTKFMPRPHAELDNEHKQFVTFTVVVHDYRIIIYRRGMYSSASDRLKGQYSVGFGGHVVDDDFGLFNAGGAALLYNSSRELMEELYLSSVYPSADQISKRSRIVGFINVDDTEDARHHVAALILMHHSTRDLPKKGELSINELQWFDPYSDSGLDFDLWSQYIVNWIGEQRVQLGRRI